MKNKIIWPWPVFSQQAIHRVADLLAIGRVNYWGSSVSKCFEEKWCEYLQIDHSYAVCNGTQALEIALDALNLEPGSEVITPARSFVATATSILRNNLRPVFCDVDKTTQGLSIETIKKQLTPQTKAIIVVHLGGWPAEIESIIEFCREKQIRVIEDCSQAHGARVGTNLVGSFGDIGVFSFCVDKIISTGGDGGLIVTADKQLAARISRLRDHGGHRSENSQAGFQYNRTLAGTNSRMTAMQMVLGLEQLEELDEQLQNRNNIAVKIRTALNDNPNFSVPQLLAVEQPSWYRIYFSIENKGVTLAEKDQFYYEVWQSLVQHGIPLANVTCPDISKEPMFAQYRELDPELVNSEYLATNCFALVSHPTISEEHLEVLLQRIRSFRIEI